MASSHEAFDHAATAETTNVSDTTLEQLQAEVQQVVRAWVIGPPLELFTQMYQVREKIYGLLDGHQWPRQTAELTLLAGQIVGLMGHASVDFGYADAGAQQARAAFAYGNIIGHNGLRAWTQLTLAGIAYYQNAPQRSVQHALRGLDYAPSAAAAVPLRLLEARARANYGDTRGAQEALAHAWRIREGDNRRDEMLDGTAGQFGSTVARQEHLAAFVPVLLGEGRQAVNLATSAISSFENGPAEERSWGCEAIARVSLAAGHALAGELDGTSEALAPVLALPATRRIEPIAARLTDLQRVLARRYEGAIPARDLTEQIEDFTRTTTARALPGPHSH